MNQFAFRYVRDGLSYRAEYRLAHWSGHRIVRDSDGEPVPFSHPSDAAIAAATALVQALNSKPAFWRGGSRNDAREKAEQFFTRAAADGSEAEAKDETEAGDDV